MSATLRLDDLRRAWECRDPELVADVAQLAEQPDPVPDQPVREGAPTWDEFLRTIKSPSFRWRYKATGQPATHQVRLYPRGADSRAPEEVVANVWGWDPSWTVTHIVNGEPRGAMSRRRGYDPRSVLLHTGPDKPAKRGWVEPVVTDHLFYAPVPSGATAIA